MKIEGRKIVDFLGIKNVKDILEMCMWGATIIIALLTLHIYQKQLDVSAMPNFEIKVIQKVVDNIPEQYLQINTGNNLKSKKIEVIPVLTVEKTENEDYSNLKILRVKMKNYFFEDNNYMNYSNAMSGTIFMEETNYHYRDIQDKIYMLHIKINNALKKRTMQLYPYVSYYVRIEYTDYADRNDIVYYEVGRFENIEISRSDYNQIQDIPDEIDFEKPYEDTLYDIVK